MVGPLKVLKMMHCKSIQSPASKSAKKEKNKELYGGRNSREASFDNYHVKEEVLNNEDLCRVCLHEGSIPIHRNGYNEDLSEALSSFAAIEVDDNDPYPKYLCHPCNALLQGAILFRKTAQASDELLKKQMKSETINESDSNELLADIDVDSHNSDAEDSELQVEKKVKMSKLTCKKCDIKFSSLEEYTEHRMSDDHENKRLPCPICKKTYAHRYIKRHMIVHTSDDGYTHICDICGKKFKSQSQFSRHRVTHFYELPFKCSLCPYRGRFTESLKMHMRSHTGEKPYQCAQCPSRFISKSNLNKHALTHRGHDFKCENNNCGKGFYTKRDLDLHVKVDHTGIKDYACRFCDKVFGYRKHVMKHERVVHKREKLQSGRTPIYLKVDTMTAC